MSPVGTKYPNSAIMTHQENPYINIRKQNNNLTTFIITTYHNINNLSRKDTDELVRHISKYKTRF